MTLWWALPATVIVLRYKNQTLLVFFCLFVCFVNNQVKLYQNILCLTIIKIFDDIYNLALWLLTLLWLFGTPRKNMSSVKTTVVKIYFCLPARMEMLGWRCVAKQLAKLAANVSALLNIVTISSNKCKINVYKGYSL